MCIKHGRRCRLCCFFLFPSLPICFPIFFVTNFHLNFYGGHFFLSINDRCFSLLLCLKASLLYLISCSPVTPSSSEHESIQICSNIAHNSILPHFHKVNFKVLFGFLVDRFFWDSTCIQANWSTLSAFVEEGKTFFSQRNFCVWLCCSDEEGVGCLWCSCFACQRCYIFFCRVVCMLGNYIEIENMGNKVKEG